MKDIGVVCMHHLPHELGDFVSKRSIVGMLPSAADASPFDSWVIFAALLFLRIFR
jgi:hypothetical protein